MGIAGKWQKPMYSNGRTYLLNSLGRDMYSIDNGVNWLSFSLENDTFKYASISNGQWYFIAPSLEKIATVLEILNVDLAYTAGKTCFL